MTTRQDVAAIFANWMNPQYMQAYAGEMTDQEVRTVRHVLEAVAFLVDQKLPSELDTETDDARDRAAALWQARLMRANTEIEQSTDTKKPPAP